MIRVIILAVVSIGLAVSASAQEDKKVALLVGVQTYDGTGLTNLKFAEKDMTDLGATLRGIGYQVSLCMKTEYKALDRAYLDPTAGNIRDQVRPSVAIGKRKIL